MRIDPVLRFPARGIALAAAVLFLAGCVDQDPFGFSRRRVVGPFRLEQWEDFTTYSLHAGRHGTLEGTVERIGWNDRYVVAWLEPSFGGDPAGWMVLDAKARETRGPLTDAEVARLPEVRDIRPMPAGEAWDRLPVRPNLVFYVVVASAAAVAAMVGIRRRPDPGEESPRAAKV